MVQVDYKREVVRILDDIPDPFAIWVIPSGFKGTLLILVEDAFSELTVKRIPEPKLKETLEGLLHSSVRVNEILNDWNKFKN